MKALGFIETKGLVGNIDATDAKSFCRRRRCMLAEGGLRII